MSTSFHCPVLCCLLNKIDQANQSMIIISFLLFKNLYSIYNKNDMQVIYNFHVTRKTPTKWYNQWSWEIDPFQSPRSTHLSLPQQHHSSPTGPLSGASPHTLRLHMPAGSFTSWSTSFRSCFRNHNKLSQLLFIWQFI